jgi:prevent-host-death family protein
MPSLQPREAAPARCLRVDGTLVTHTVVTMPTIAATKFKQRCLALLDTVGPEGIVITKHGRPVARLVPIKPGNGDLIGCLAGKIEVHGDLMDTESPWTAES